MPATTERRCSKCAFFGITDPHGLGRGVCRFNPPTCVGVTSRDQEGGPGEGYVVTAWPNVLGGDFCSRFAKRPGGNDVVEDAQRQLREAERERIARGARGEIAEGEDE